MPDVECRISKLEEKIDKILDKIEEVKTDQAKIKGYTRGVASSFAVVGALIAVIWEQVKRG